MEQRISPALILVPALGLGLLGALGVAYLARAAPEEPEPEPGPEEPGVVTIALKHPPPEAENWSLTLTDWDITVPIHEIYDKDRLDITEPAIFEIPGGLNFPLRAAFLQITKWNENRTALIQLYYIQAMHPYLWDWDEGEYGTELDLDYREAFIPSYGSYFFNVATGLFEPMGIAKPLELQAAP